MTILKKAAGFLVGGLLGGALGLGAKKPKIPRPLPVARRDEAAEAAMADDELRRRRGASADILTGRTGAEAALGQTAKFIPGN